MRKAAELTVFAALFCSPVFPQAPTPKASVYFPIGNGAVWTYVQNVLDSSQHPIDSTESFRKDLMIGQTVTGIDGIEWTTQWIKTVSGGAPDTVKWSTYENTVKRYFEIGKLFPQLAIDSLGLARFNGTYTVMNFSSGVNSSDTLIRFDTSITIDSVTLPVRFSFTSKKLSERSMTVRSVNYSVTPYVFKFAVTVLYPTFIGTVKIPVAELYDSTFVAKGKWIVRRVTPSTVIPIPSAAYALLGLTLPETKIAGSLEELQSFTLDVRNSKSIPGEFLLEQNFPNPFNPATTISFAVAKKQHVILTVFDLLGRIVAEPVNGEYEAGRFTFRYDGSVSASGIYFYRMRCGSFTETKKMIIQK